MKTKQLKSIWSLLLLSLLIVTACSKEDPVLPPFGVAFKTTSLGLDDKTASIDAVVTFSRTTTVANTITIRVAETGVSYDTEYTTTPVVKDGKVTITAPAGASEVRFTITRKVPLIAPGAKINFTLEKVAGETTTQISGNTALDLVFKAISSPSGAMKPQVGGPKQPNIAFVDLSLAANTTAKRLDWDLGFYSGSEDKVILNYSTFMMAKALAKSNMNSVGAADTAGFAASVKTLVRGSNNYIDHHDGDLAKTVINVSATAADNKVYIINLGAGPGTTDPRVGSVNVGGTPRGWKKIRILKEDNNYKLQYANIAATTFEEATISRDAAYSFSYFSLVNKTSVKIAPKKAQWDFSFSPCTVNFRGFLAYGFADYVRINKHGGTKVYMINNDKDRDNAQDPGTTSFDDFKLTNVDNSKFSEAANAIGSNWRSLGRRGSSIFNHRYFILKDSEGNLYKIQFTAIKNEAGERGHPTFKYELLK